MALDLHTVSVPSGASPAFLDRIVVGNRPGVANIAGAAGVTVTTPIAMTDLPPEYSVYVNPGQGCGWYVDGQTSAGFSVHLVPFSGTATVAAGAFDVTVIA
jgi:hypothetical protein